jgi:tetratricopeptide (TPR) repeat protein
MLESNLIKLSYSTINRVNLINEIDRILRNGQYAVISGNSGLGKSYLAVQYSQRHQQMYKNLSVIRFINSENEMKIYENYKEVLYALNNSIKLNHDLTDKNLIRNLVNYSLNDLIKNNQMVLLIFDNVTNFDDISNYIDTLPPNVKFLITTKLKVNKNENALEMKQFSREEFSDFLNDFNKTSVLNENQIDLIYKSLASNEKLSPYNAQKLLIILNQNKNDLDQNFFKELKSNPNEILIDRFFEVILSKNAELKSLKLQIMTYLSHLDSDFIDFNFLIDLLTSSLSNENKKNLTDLLMNLGESSIINLNKNFISVHPLYQKEFNDFIRHRKIENNREKIQDLIVEYLVKNLPSIDKNFIDHKRMISHSLFCKNYESFYLNYTQSKAQLLFELSRYYQFVILDLNKSLDCALISLEFYKKINSNGEFDSRIVSLLNNLSVIHLNLEEDVKKSIDNATQAFQLSKKLNNYEHISESLSNLALVYCRMGDFNKSLGYYEQILDLTKAKNSKNSDDEISINTLNKIGMVYRSMKQYDKALDYLKQSYDLKNRSNKTDLGSLLNDIGLVYQSSGDLNRAINSFEQSFNTYKKNNDLNVEMTKPLNNLSVCYQTTGDFHKSLSYLQQSYEIYSNLFKSDHPTLGFCLNSIGSVYEHIGDFEKSNECLTKSLDIFVSLHKENHHPDIAASLNSLGIFYQNTGQFDEALNNLLKSFNMYNRIFNNSDNPIIAHLLGHIGSVYQSLNEFDNALDYMQKSLDMKKRLLKKDLVTKIEIGQSLNTIGMLYLQMKDFNKSLAFLNQAFELFKQNQVQPLIAMTCFNIGDVFKQKNDFEKACNYFKQSLDACDLHEKIARMETLKSIIYCYEKLGDKENSSLYKSKLLEYFKAVKERTII